ncbi:tetratricopeptide repeat protein [Streptomyces griseorubiginosus]|uniref:tetratricopeptide repeat protein n=1 Tax=Streptomyces griseorubiginosus TaxID=67304 RepID=UPI003676F645
MSVEVPVGRLDSAFVGRQRMLQELDQAIRREEGHPASVILCGLGGSGKSTVAIAAAHRAIERGAEVWWVSASTSSELHSGMRQVAYRIGSNDRELGRAWGGPESATDHLWQHLMRRTRPWLLVVDNADDPAMLAAPGHTLADGNGWLRPVQSEHGFILVTSRDSNARRWGHWWRLRTVGMLDRADSATVLQRLAGPQAGSAEDAAALGDRLGRLPLALRLAGVYLAETADNPWPGPATTYAEYQAALEDGRMSDLADQELNQMDSEGHEAHDRAVIGRTWELSLDLLEQRGMPEARPLLRLLSCFALAPFPYGVLLHPEVLRGSPLFTRIDATSLWRLLRALADLSLITLSPTQEAENSESEMVGGLLHMHPLVRDASQAQQDAADHRRDYLELCAELLERAAPTDQPLTPEDPHHWPRWEALTPHALHLMNCLIALDEPLPEATARVGGTVTRAARCQRARGLYAQAQETFEIAVRGCDGVLGQDDEITLAARHGLAAILHFCSRYDAAEAEYRQVLDSSRRALGNDHSSTLKTWHQWAYLLHERGRFDEAETEYRTLLDIRRSCQGETALGTLISRHGLGRLLTDAGRPHEAAQELRTVVEHMSQTLGEVHPMTLKARSDLARANGESGQTALAERELSATLSEQLRILHADHRDVLVTRTRIAALWLSQGRLNAAEEELRAALSAQTTALGDDHPHALITRCFLADMLRDRGDSTAAAAEYQTVLRSRQQLLGQDHPATRAALQALQQLQT